MSDLDENSYQANKDWSRFILAQEGCEEYYNEHGKWPTKEELLSWGHPDYQVEDLISWMEDYEG